MRAGGARLAPHRRSAVVGLAGCHREPLTQPQGERQAEFDQLVEASASCAHEDDAFDLITAIAKRPATNVPEVAAILGPWREVPGT